MRAANRDFSPLRRAFWIRSRAKRIRIPTFFCLLLSASTSFAAQTQGNTQDLHLFDERVREWKAPGISTQKRTTSAVTLGSFQPSWTWIALHRAGADPQGPPLWHAARFHFQASASKLPQGVRLEARQIAEPNGPTRWVDARVERLILEIDSQGVTRAKAYRIPPLSQPLQVSTVGFRARSTAWEAFPLELPDLRRARVLENPSPLSPSEMRALSVALGREVRALPSTAVTLESEDFFGRRIEVGMEQNRVWPVWIRSQQGIGVVAESIE